MRLSSPASGRGFNVSSVLTLVFAVAALQTLLTPFCLAEAALLNARNVTTRQTSPFYTEVKSTTDVSGDGNCGYRAVSVQIYEDQKEWAQVRRDLRAELKRHPELYARVFSHSSELTATGKEMFREAVRQVDHYKSPCGQTYQLDMTYQGHVLANAYKAPVVLYAAQGRPGAFDKITFLPYTRDGEGEKVEVAEQAKWPFGLLLRRHHYNALELKSTYTLENVVEQWEQFAEAEVKAAWRPLVKNTL